MSNSFENFDFFSKKSDLSVSRSLKQSSSSNVRNINSPNAKSFKDVFKDINALLETEEIKQQNE